MHQSSKNYFASITAANVWSDLIFQKQRTWNFINIGQQSVDSYCYIWYLILVLWYCAEPCGHRAALAGAFAMLPLPLQHHSVSTLVTLQASAILSELIAFFWNSTNICNAVARQLGFLHLVSFLNVFQLTTGIADVDVKQYKHENLVEWRELEWIINVKQSIFVSFSRSHA